MSRHRAFAATIANGFESRRSPPPSKAELGELLRISRFLSLVVFVNATADFTEHHPVANGATDLLVRVFGAVGRAALSEVGVASLPFNGAVEIAAIVEINAYVVTTTERTYDYEGLGTR